MDFDFKKVGEYDIKNIFDSLLTLKDEWDTYPFRQDTYETHKETKCIPLLYDEKYLHQRGQETEFYHLFEQDIDNIQNKLNTFYNTNGEIIRIEIVKMPSQSNVRMHYDSGYSLTIDSRLHIPIQTNSKVIFTIGESTRNLKVGEIWEINNTNKLHGVSNNGSEDRIHMIIDYNLNNTKTII